MSRNSVLRLAAQLARQHLGSTQHLASGADIANASIHRQQTSVTCLRNFSLAQFTGLPAAARAAAPAAAPAAPAPCGNPGSSSSIARSYSTTTPPVEQSGGGDAAAATNAGVAAPGHVNNPPMPPWTPTRNLIKRKTYAKRMGFMIQTLEKEHQEQLAAERKHPSFGPGDVLQLKLLVPENKRRQAVFKGLCIARSNRGPRTTFTLRNYLGNAGGVERTFPLYSPNILGIEVLESRRVRRAKLYYMRNRQPKEFRV